MAPGAPSAQIPNDAVPIPAICFNGHVFGFGYFLTPGGSVTFAGCVAGPCPRCGAGGTIPDGIYTFTEDLLVVAKTIGLRGLQALLPILSRARDKGASPQEVADQLRKEPERVRKLADLLPQSRPDWIAYLGILVSIIVAAIQILQASGGNTTIINNNLTIQNVFNLATSPPPTPKPKQTPHRRAKAKVGPNDPCECGSGAKKKKCHRI